MILLCFQHFEQSTFASNALTICVKVIASHVFVILRVLLERLYKLAEGKACWLSGHNSDYHDPLTFDFLLPSVHLTTLCKDCLHFFAPKLPQCRGAFSCFCGLTVCNCLKLRHVLHAPMQGLGIIIMMKVGIAQPAHVLKLDHMQLHPGATL